MSSNKTPENISFDDDIDLAMLDFEKIKELSKQAQKRFSQGKSDVGLSQAEKKSIPIYINDIVSYIKKYALQGKFKFEYDCSQLSVACFNELATTFKQNNPLFYVSQHHHLKILTIEWTGKNEV
jgi:hypothetical protein